jgi:hypothetical protein
LIRDEEDGEKGYALAMRHFASHGGTKKVHGHVVKMREAAVSKKSGDSVCPRRRYRTRLSCSSMGRPTRSETRIFFTAHVVCLLPAFVTMPSHT